MAFDFHAVKGLLFSKKSGVDYRNTATIGRQQIVLALQASRNLFNSFNISITKSELNSIISNSNGYGESILRILGAEKICSIDASSYEGASYIHDMNIPIPGHLKNKFTVVIDGGCLEHIFNFPMAIKNCMEMVQEGGHFIGITPTNNFMGHGFYQFSPELFFRIFSKDNGFAIIKVFAFESFAGASWYEVIDPAIIQERVGLRNLRPILLFILAKKLKNESIFAHYPQQSDYVLLWNNINNLSGILYQEPQYYNIFYYIKLLLKFIIKPYRYINRFNRKYFIKANKYDLSNCKDNNSDS